MALRLVGHPGAAICCTVSLPTSRDAHSVLRPGVNVKPYFLGARAMYSSSAA